MQVQGSIDNCSFVPFSGSNCVVWAFVIHDDIFCPNDFVTEDATTGRSHSQRKKGKREE